MVRQGEVGHRIDLFDDRVGALEFGGPNRGFRTAGLIIGITADATIIVVAAALSSSSPSYGSCEPTYTGGSYARAIPAPTSIALDSVYVLPHARVVLAPLSIEGLAGSSFSEPMK